MFFGITENIKMIGYLKGHIQYVNSELVIIVVSGVGYQVYMPARNLQMVETGEEIEVYVFTHVKEDQLKLFGFEDMPQRNMFELLLSINGVGPKAALSIMSAGTSSQIHKAVAEADVQFFVKVKGLGKKTAQKIIIELKGKLGSIKELDLADDEGNYSSDVVEALAGFGFGRKEVVEVLDKLDKNMNENEMIKQALKYLGK